MPLRRSLMMAAVTVALSFACMSFAGGFPVTYLADANGVRKMSPGTPVTFELYADAACTTLVHSEVVNAGDIDSIEELKTAQLRGQKRTHRARLSHVLTGVSSITGVQELHLKVVATDLVPVGDACQVQTGSLPAASACPPDAVRVGNICVDKFEASVWQVPTSNQTLITKIRQGTVTLADLTGAGATQLGCTNPPYGHALFPVNFPPVADWTPIPGSDPPSPGVYAVSIPGVYPTACINQFRALQACALSGKRLIRNDEWQTAVAGTPDPGLLDNGTTTCATGFTGLAQTGARTACVSSWGVHDMVGNVWEWTGDWTDQNALECASWTGSAGIGGNDTSCFAGFANSAEGHIPGVIIRGGHYYDGDASGPLAIHSDFQPNDAGDVGVRCVR